MDIVIPDDLCPRINQVMIASACSADELHALLGPPTYIAGPKGPVPRNNQWHVYEAAGLVFYERRRTGRITGCSAVFQPEDFDLPVALPRPFGGALQLGRLELSPGIGKKDTLRNCGFAFKSQSGSYIASHKRHSVMLIFRSAKLPSGGFSRATRLVSVELSWPHDPWGETADVGDP
jgi:hypothetical protein